MRGRPSFLRATPASEKVKLSSRPIVTQNKNEGLFAVQEAINSTRNTLLVLIFAGT